MGRRRRGAQPGPFFPPAPTNQLTVSLSIEADFQRDFAGWPPANVAAFMDGLARVLSAHRLPPVTRRGLSPMASRRHV
jgi:hypothetical protein